MTKILFTGDSITETGRNKQVPEHVGTGYVHYIKGRLDCDYPGEYDIWNTGIGGNRMVDLYARIKIDVINLKPDVISVLMGINGIWSELGAQNGIDAAKFEKFYDMFLSEVKDSLPNVMFVLMGAYVTKSTATEPYWDTFEPETAKRAEIAKKLAEKYDALYIPLQEEFDKAVARMPEPYWTKEGVHPLESGHQLIADAWLKVFMN